MGSYVENFENMFSKELLIKELDAFETLLEYYIKAEGFTGITLKLFDTYGETDTRPKLINFLNKFADEETELNMSPGEQMLNLVHIDDVCSAFEVAFNLLENNTNRHSIYAIANKESYKLKVSHD